MAGARAIPTDERLIFQNAGWPTSPVAGADFGAVVRVYTGVAGTRAWAVLVGLTGEPRLQLANGWRVVNWAVDERDGVKVLELAR